MKFVAKPGAPDLPLALLEAQETGRLALFCGAGISYPAGLPGFSGLVKKIYAELGTTPEPLEKTALRQRLYDRVLELIERRHHKGQGKANPMRTLLTELLEIKGGASLNTHKSILQIATGPSGHRRLVTTNFDHGFLIADPATREETHAAPRLPVPKPHKWNSIVYLHGLLDPKNDPGNENLVLTSGDFGAAYLTERWASKFVTELFSYYTVLFVGYSIDDPVIRYMTDAIAADRRLGSDDVKQPYVLARTTPSKYRVDSEAWAAKGVQPILYHSDRLHGHLHKTLEKWAAYCKDGLNAKERIIRTKGIIAPLPPYEDDETVNQILDILREKEDLSEAVSGYPARVFASLDDPPAPIDWLTVFESHNLLERSIFPGYVRPVHSSHGAGLYSKPNLISAHIWAWLCHHLESRGLVNWVIDNGSCLHPDFAFEVQRRLTGSNPPSAPFDNFWWALVLGLVECGGDSFDRGFIDIKPAVVAGDDMGLRALLEMLVPRLAFEKSFDWAAVYSELQEEPPEHAPFTAKVSIRLSEWEFGELSEIEGYPGMLINILPDLSARLLEALQLMSTFGNAGFDFDRSYWDLPSIDPHPQNNRFNNWTFLIELCRDTWLAAWDSGSSLAPAVFSQWRAGQFPVFRRLAMHSATQRPILEPNQALRLLLGDDENMWLWSIEVYREKFRLLAAIWPRLTADAAQLLEDAIVQGPPRSMYKDELTVDEWNDRKDRDVWLHLLKLQSYGRDLSRGSAAELQRITGAHPQWSHYGDERDEFVSWMESGFGVRTDVSPEQMTEMDVARRVEYLQQEAGEYQEGRVDVFRGCSQENPDFAIETLSYLAERRDWNPAIWHAGLMGVASSSAPAQPRLFQFVLEADDRLIAEEAWVIAYWLRKAAAEVEPNSDLEGNYWPVFDRVYDTSLRREIELGEDPVGQAINDPVGILVESFLDRLGSRRLRTDARFSAPEIAQRLDHIVLQNQGPGVLGITVLFSRLHYFHGVDPSWCRQRMLPYLDWDSSGIARLCWLGYLWVPRVSVELATDIAPALLQTLAHSDELDRHPDRAADLFGVICLEFPDVFSSTEISEGLAISGSDGYTTISKLIWRSLRVENGGLDDADALQAQSNSDSYWSGRVAPFISNHWSRDVRYRSEKRSENLALAALQLDLAFVDAVALVRPFLGPVSRPGFIFRMALKKEGLIQRYPAEVFAIVDEVFPDNWPYPDTSLRQLLNLIAQASPELRVRNVRYREIDQILVARGQ